MCFFPLLFSHKNLPSSLPDPSSSWIADFSMHSSDALGLFQVKKKEKKSIGRILLKGDNITLMMNTGSS